MKAALSAGARLSFVVIPLEGTVKRTVTLWSKDEGLQQVEREEEAGFLVFFPRGHVMRIRTQQELAHYKLDQDPKFMDMKGLYDPNTAIGKLFSSQDGPERVGAYRQLEAQVVALATAKSGRGSIMPEQSTGAIDIPFPTFEEAEAPGAPTMLRQSRARGRNRNAHAE